MLIAGLGQQAGLLAQGHAEATTGYQGGLEFGLWLGGGAHQKIFRFRLQGATTQQQCGHGQHGELKRSDMVMHRPCIWSVPERPLSRGSGPQHSELVANRRLKKCKKT